MRSTGSRPKTPPRPSAVRTIKLFFPCNLAQARLAGCPYTAISLLTGEDAFWLRSKYGGKFGLSTKEMVGHFRDLKFEVTALNHSYCLGLIQCGRAIGDSHVILASMRMSTEESSWVVMHGGLVWHNFEPFAQSAASTLTMPIEYAFLLYTDEWRDAACDAVRQREQWDSFDHPIDKE